MSFDYAAIAKKSAQNLESDTIKFREGQTLLGLVPYERGFPIGYPSLTVEAFSGGEGSLQDAFKRTVCTLEQPYVRESAYFAEAIGRHVGSECPLKKYAVDNLPSKAAKTNPVTYWVVVPLAFRTQEKFEFQEDYTKPKIMTAKVGKKTDPHIQGQLDSIFARGGAELIQRVLNPMEQQLLVVERIGMGQTNTKFVVSLAEGEYANWTMSDEILNDIDEATKVGGSCDLNAFVSQKFFPDAEEIANRLYGEGDSEGMKEG